MAGSAFPAGIFSGASGFSGAVPYLLEGTEFKDIGEAVNALGSVSGATAVNIHDGDVITATTTDATTWSFNNPFPSGKACTLTLFLTNGGAGTQTWPTTTLWPNGTPPSTLSVSGTDILVFITIDGGTTWRGTLSGTNYS